MVVNKHIGFTSPWRFCRRGKEYETAEFVIE